MTILSHELTHAELHYRVGVSRSAHSIPHWFDEGLAVLVSQDPRCSFSSWCKVTNGGQNAPKPQAIGRLLGHGNWLLSYGTAREMVWIRYSRVGCNGLEQLIKVFKSGASFVSAFNAIAKANGTKPRNCTENLSGHHTNAHG